MAQQVTADALLSTIYKAWYTEKRFPNLLFRNSPVLKKIEKNKIGGLNYRVSMLYGRGGGVAGDYTIAVANAASASRNAEMTITPGNIHCVFNVTQKEILAGADKKGAYIKPLINRMFAATESLRKTFAACLYGFGAGDVGALPVAGVAAAASCTMSYDTIVKIDVGTQFYVVNGTTPLAAYYDAVVRTVSAIDGTTVTFTGGGVTAGGWAAGSLVELNGGRDATPLPSMPTGLAAWLPSVANRTGATWTTYIGTAFYGVTRSLNVNALAGWFYQRIPGQAKVDAIVQGIKLARRGGGVPTIIAVNDDDFSDILEECNQQTTLFQTVNQTGKNSTNEVVRGLAKMRYSFSTSWIDKCYDDPYCPKGICYILDEEVIEFASLSDAAEKVANDGITENEPGTASVETGKEPDTTFALKIDDYINIVPNSTSVEGPAAQVSLSVYGNFVVREPGHCAVVVF